VTNLPASRWCYDSSAAKVYVHKADGSSPASNVVEVGSRTGSLKISTLASHQHDITVDGLTIWGDEGYCTGRGHPFDATYAGAGITITNTSLVYCGNGIYITGAVSPIITNNTVSDMAMGWTYPPTGGGDPVTQGLFGIRTQNDSGSLTVSGNILTRLATHFSPLCTGTCSNNACSNGTGMCPNCAVSGGANRAACFTFAMSFQSVDGLLTITDNTLSDVESGMSVKIDAGAVLTAGSTISRNVLRGWAHAPTSDAYDASDTALGLFCEGNATGGPVDCTSASQPTPKPIAHALTMERNQILGGFRGGVLISIANKQAGDAFTVRVANNIIKAGDRTFGNAFEAAVHVYPGTSGVQVYNNTLRCETPSAGGGSGLFIGSGANVDFRNNILDFDACGAKITDNSTVDSWSVSDNIGDVANSGRCAAGANTLSYVNENGNPPDLHLLLPSTAVVDMGAVLQGITTDVDNQARPQGAGVDIGADEVLVGSAAPPPPTLLSVNPLP
jgi:hypothetical protein